MANGVPLDSFRKSVGTVYTKTMDLADLFGLQGLQVGFAPPDKWVAIQQLVAGLTESGRLDPDRHDAALEAVLRRERSMSTGMEKGIAIPHAAIPGIPNVLAVLGITPSGEGISFESMDGAPTELVVLLLIPKDQKLLHIRTLADVARILGREAVRAELTQAADAQTALEVLRVASMGS